jgi:RNA polymerase sigma-70 factor (ECF subfamily)
MVGEAPSASSKHLKTSISVREIFDAHTDFVWRVLARAGVRESDLQDATQEVFIIVADKLPQYDAGTKATTWLYAIAIRVGANYRRKVQRKREDLVEESVERVATGEDHDPEQGVVRAQARMQLARLLERLAPEQRIVFEMFELDEMTCQAIADALGIPLGTTYTRLRAARAALTEHARMLAEEEP